MDKTVTISLKEYNRLRIAEEKLEYLEVAGVDNWSNYGCQCDIYGDEECIFCTEDKIAYLSSKEE